MVLERRIKYFLYDFNDCSSIFTGPMRSKNTPDLCADIHMYIDDWPWIGRDKKVYQKFKYIINASLSKKNKTIIIIFLSLKLVEN